MIKLTDAIRTLLNDNPGPGNVVCVVGTAALHNGYPQLSPKGSVIAYEPNQFYNPGRSGKRAKAARQPSGSYGYGGFSSPSYFYND